MPPLPSLPKSELEIARIVWRLGSASVREVVDALPADRELDYWTVQTYLRRLEEKGFLKVKKQGRANVYQPRLAPRTVIRQLVQDFLEQMFDGDAAPLVQHLIQERDLSLEDVEELQKSLHESRRKEGEA